MTKDLSFTIMPVLFMDQFSRSDFNQKVYEQRNQENLSRQEKDQYRQARSRKPSRLKFFSCFLIVVIVIVWILTGLLGSANDNLFGGIKNGYIVRQLTNMFSGQGFSLRGEDTERINFLLLGMGGPGHEGPYLTDTIMLASFDLQTKQAAIISVPRDLVVPFGDGTYRKVNSIYALTRPQGEEQALERLKNIFNLTFGVPIHYVATIDFQGFVEIIDTVGGIKVNVDQAFTDNQFPSADYKTSSVSFAAGEQKMDGLTALRYARSRHGNNGEGSDFARSRRQQKIIGALKEKLTTLNTLINPVKITRIYNLITAYTSTDLKVWEAVKLAQLVKDVDLNNIQNYVLDDAPGSFLTGGISTLDGAYILQPRTGNYRELQDFMINIFNRNQAKAEAGVILLQNGTTIPGLATEVTNELSKRGVAIERFGNANKQDYPTTLIYDYTKGKKPLTRKILEEQLKTTASENPPLDLLAYTVAKQWNILDDKEQVKTLDFLIILGSDLPAKLTSVPLIELVPIGSTTTASNTATSTTETTPVEN